MDGYWAAVILELALLTLLVAIALWALFDADRLRALWIAERERRVNGSRECTCGAYRRCFSTMCRRPLTFCTAIYRVKSPDTSSA